MKKNDLAKVVANYLTKNRKKKIQKFNTKLFNFDDSIFSNEKLDQRYNQFKFDPSIFSNEKP
ncbi:MAG: hypothetical protein H9Q66_06670, partial [Spiroplasma ixodetis]|nr:hypothetical protein [Spiroplasma ixodetis]